MGKTSKVRPIMISLIAFAHIVVLYLILSNDQTLIEIFKKRRDGTLSSFLENELTLFLSGDPKIGHLFSKWIIGFMDILLPLVLLAGFYYLITLILFENVTFPRISASWKLLPKTSSAWANMFFLYFPFTYFIGNILFASENEVSDLVTFLVCLSILLAVYLRKKDCPLPWIYRWTHIFTILVMSIYLYSWYSNSWLSIVVSIFYVYIITSILMGFFRIFIYLIKLDYRSAAVDKENTLIFDALLTKNKETHYLLHPFDKMSKDEIHEVIERRTAIPLVRRKKLRASLLKSRNKMNLYLSAVYMLLTLLLVFVSGLWTRNVQDHLLICLCLMLFFRLVARSVEISFAFYFDVVKVKPKQSLLDGSDRLKLAISSLLEIMLLTVAIEYTYKLFLKAGILLETPWEHMKTVVSMFLYRFSIQVFNYSFNTGDDLFMKIVHVIQILTAVCLILLAISSYLNMQRLEYEYEVTVIEDGRFKLKEILYFHKDSEIETMEKENEEYCSPLKLDDLWRDNVLDKEEYILRKRAFWEWERWEEENIKLKSEWCADEIQNLYSLNLSVKARGQSLLTTVKKIIRNYKERFWRKEEVTRIHRTLEAYLESRFHAEYKDLGKDIKEIVDPEQLNYLLRKLFETDDLESVKRLIEEVRNRQK